MGKLMHVSLVLIYAVVSTFGGTMLGNQLKLVLDGFFDLPPVAQPPPTLRPDYGQPQNCQANYCPPQQPYPQPQPCQPLQPILLCPPFNYREEILMLKAVDSFVNEFYNSTPSMLNPFASEFRKEFSGISTKIERNILDLAEQFSRQWGPTEDGKLCRILKIANLVGRNPKTNPKFWFKAMSRIIQTHPKLGKDELEVNPLSALELLFAKRVLIRRKRNSDSYQSPHGRNFQPCPVLEDAEEIFSSAVPSFTICTGRQGDVSDPDENALWYFREDSGLNVYHNSWHTDHPPDGTLCGDKRTQGCHAQRRGELFYYFHRNLLARYDTERLSHGMGSTLPLKIAQNVQINPGYKPNYYDGNRNPFEERRPGLYLPHSLLPTKRGKFFEFLNHLSNLETLPERYRQLFSVTRRQMHAVDLLTNTIESSSIISNKDVYGSIHNDGHLILANAGSMRETPNAVISELSHALRDPVFYRWHRYLDSLVQRHKNLLQPYKLEEGAFSLLWKPVVVQDASVNSLGGPYPNILHTFWRQRRYSKKEDCRKYLDHEDFNLTFKIENSGNFRAAATIRTFLVPKNDQNGIKLWLEEQRNFIFPLDVFNTYLNPGKNIVQRSSDWLATVAPRFNDKRLQQNRGDGKEVNCLCGHPHNLLLPKGNDCGGVEYILIVLVTDGTKFPFNFTEDLAGTCYRPPVTCGVDGGGTADLVLPLGYPFDRRVSPEWNMIDDMAGALTNMNAKEIGIVHHDVLLQIDENLDEGERRTFHSPSCVESRTPLPEMLFSSTTTTSTPTTSRAECWYNYSGIRNCGPIPLNYSCQQFYGLPYCKPVETTAATSTVAGCYYDQNGARHCHAPPANYNCHENHGVKYCFPSTTIAPVHYHTHATPGYGSYGTRIQSTAVPRYGSYQTTSGYRSYTSATSYSPYTRGHSHNSHNNNYNPYSGYRNLGY